MAATGQKIPRENLTTPIVDYLARPVSIFPHTVEIGRQDVDNPAIQVSKSVHCLCRIIANVKAGKPQVLSLHSFGATLGDM
jgi:hypothetical protein